MAKNTTLKTRIQNRHDTEANWTTASNATKPFIPLKGEIIVYDPDTTNTSPRVKIGDGVTKVGDLAFVGGDISKYVTLDTTQTVTGSKTFSKRTSFNAGAEFTGDEYIRGELIVSKNAKSGADATGDGRVMINNSASIQSTQNTGSIWNQASLSYQGLIFSASDYPFSTPGNNYNKALRINPNLPSKAESDTTQDLTLNIPFKSGTLATLDDIPSIPTNYVTTDTDQTISGIKTFTEGLKVDSIKTTNNVVLLSTNSIATQVSNSSRRLLLCGNEARPKYSLNSGNTATEIALLSDIPTNYITTDTAQTISGVKTFTGAIQLQGVGIAAKVGGENSSYTNILKGGGNVVEVGSTGYQTRIYSNGRISVYDYSTSPYTSEKVAYQSEIPTIPADNLTKSNFNTQMAEGFSLEDDVNGGLITVVPNSIIVKNRASSGQQIEVKSSGIIYSRDAENIKTTINFVDNPNITINMPSTSGTLLTDADLSIAPIKVKDTFVASSWSTSSAATDTQFGKYYKDVTIPNKNIINVRCVSTKGMSGITLDYAPEIKCNNRRTSDTNLRIYSNSQLEGAVTITLVGDTLPNKFSKTNATLSVSSWTTSSATVDTQFAKYYTDITVPAGDVMNIRILSNEDITGISTAAYYPEVWSDNRKIDSTTLRVYSNKQVAGSVIILTMEV